ncbi:MAG: apolipoprotein N-acyltransferase, partial [Desulfobacula sp.]|nr:apolipoprotein N-acyltransferase [Desulfobacula sp.]
PTIHVYGGLNIILAVCVLTLFCLYLALYPAIFTLILKRLEQSNQSAIDSYYIPVVAALLWTCLEYIRTYAFTGFPWGALGYSQFRNLNLIQIADFTGVYGVSFLVVLVNSSLALFWINYKKIKSKKHYIIPIFYTIAMVAAAYIYGDLKIKNINSQIKNSQKTKITIIQGNIKQDLKWSDEFKLKTIEKYIQLSKSQIKKRPDLVIWPETAMPFYYGLEQVLSSQVDQCVQLSKTNFLVGSPALEVDGKDTKFYNRTYMLDKSANIKGIWDKHHLIPFGEYVPFDNYLNFLGKITAQAGNFSPGKQSFIPLEFSDNTQDDTLNPQVKAIQKDSLKTGVLICFEILFPSTASKFVKNGADILTTITNDAWFGYSSAAMQHFSIAVFRAVENRRTMARAANTGISGFIDPTGKIIKTTALFKDYALTHDVPALKHLS